MPRAGLSPQAVVDVALQVLDGEGTAAVTLAKVAENAGVATPSLYKHVKNLAELRHLMAARIIDDLGTTVAEAVLGRSGEDAVRALMNAIRDYAVRYPCRYAAMDQSHNPALAEPAERLLRIILAALRGFDLDESTAIHVTRCIRSAAHGFALLETGGGFGFPEKLDDTYELLVNMVIAGLPANR